MVYEVKQARPSKAIEQLLDYLNIPTYQLLKNIFMFKNIFSLFFTNYYLSTYMLDGKRDIREYLVGRGETNKFASTLRQFIWSEKPGRAGRQAVKEVPRKSVLSF